MIIYEALKKNFVEDVREDVLVTKLYNQYQEKIGQTSLNEIRSWNNSLVRMRDVIDDVAIPDNSGIAIEFNIPYTSKRVDFIVSGKNEKDNNAAIIIELKQWDKIEEVDDKDGICKDFFRWWSKRNNPPFLSGFYLQKDD